MGEMESYKSNKQPGCLGATRRPVWLGAEVRPEWGGPYPEGSGGGLRECSKEGQRQDES